MYTHANLERFPDEVHEDISSGNITAMEGPSLVLQYSVIEEDRLPLVLERVVQYQLQDTKNLK